MEQKLKAGHPIHTLMEEHKMILGFIDKLRGIVEGLESAKNYDDVDMKKLKHIAEHLVEADYHHKREEDVLFPAIEENGINGPTECMRGEHVELKKRKKALLEIVKNYKSISFGDFARKVDENAQYIIEELPNHIQKEDDILYPMALEAIPSKDWAGIKKRCDKIGYCCFTPKC